jgi:hypothetical protein
MDTSKFFQVKRQESQKNNPQLPRLPGDVKPWWQDASYTQSNRDRDTQPLETVDDKHDFSRADHLRSGNNICPNCGSTSFVKPSASVASRCFDCGYIDGRQVNDLDTMNIMSLNGDAATLKVKQTADGGAQKYRARISRNAAEINKANAELEAVHNGKAYVDS